MSRILKSCRNGILACGLFLGLVVPFAGANGAGYSVLYTFQGGGDGGYPNSSLIVDKAGNLYGTASWGGFYSQFTCAQGCGVVFKVAPDGTETTLYAFKGASDGEFPGGGLIRDRGGNIYGTAGGYDVLGCQKYGCGVVFKLAPDGTETVLHAFTGASDGSSPWGLTPDGHGTFYGVTEKGGARGAGTVYKLARNGKLSLLHTFCSYSNCGDGENPSSAPILDKAGNLYGTTMGGGGGGCNGGCGVVFKLAKDGTETVLLRFTGKRDCGNPGGLTVDAAGNLFGTTYGYNACTKGIYGTVFEIAANGTATILHRFKGWPDDGAYPTGSLAWGSEGRLFGTTTYGGSQAYGSIFTITPDGRRRIVYSFASEALGYFPYEGVTVTPTAIYGTTYGGGGGDCLAMSTCGVVFKLQR